MEIREKINELERQLNELKASLKEEAKDDRPITERVKTFEDALDILGEEHLFVRSYREWMRVRIHKQNDIDAYLKLRIITAALNEGWEPKFTQNEYRYYPWFALYTQEEWDVLSEGEKKCGVLFGGAVAYGADAGFVSAASRDTTSCALFGSRLCFKTDALARYAGQQFADLYADYLLIKK